MAVSLEIDIRSLNQTYLVILRDAIKSDLAQACLAFGINEKACQDDRGNVADGNQRSGGTDQMLFRTSLTSEILTNLSRIADPVKKSVFAMLASV